MRENKADWQGEGGGKKREVFDLVVTVSKTNIFVLMWLP
jgi:hypothetical protein